MSTANVSAALEPTEPELLPSPSDMGFRHRWFAKAIRARLDRGLALTREQEAILEHPVVQDALVNRFLPDSTLTPESTWGSEIDLPEGEGLRRRREAAATAWALRQATGLSADRGPDG